MALHSSTKGARCRSMALRCERVALRWPTDGDRWAREASHTDDMALYSQRMAPTQARGAPGAARDPRRPAGGAVPSVALAPRSTCVALSPSSRAPGAAAVALRRRSERPRPHARAPGASRPRDRIERRSSSLRRGSATRFDRGAWCCEASGALAEPSASLAGRTALLVDRSAMDSDASATVRDGTASSHDPGASSTELRARVRAPGGRAPLCRTERMAKNRSKRHAAARAAVPIAPSELATAPSALATAPSELPTAPSALPTASPAVVTEADTEPTSVRWLAMAPAVLAGVFLLTFLLVSVRRIAYPFALEWMEGGMLDEV